MNGWEVAVEGMDAAAGAIDWRAVFRANPAATCVLAADGCVVDANAAFCDLVGTPLPALAGRPFDRLKAVGGPGGRPWSADVTGRGVAILERTDGTLHDVIYAVSESGGGGWLLVLSDAVPEGCPACLIHGSREKFRRAVDDLSELICRCTPDLAITLVNRAFADLNALTPPQMIGRDLAVHLPGPVVDAVRRFVAEATPDAPVAAVEEALPHPDGTVRWVAWRWMALFDGSGRLAAIQAVGRDTTQRRLAEEERLRLAAMVDRSPVAGLAWRVEGRCPIEYATSNAGRVLDRDPQDVPGVGLLDLVHADDAAALAAWVAAVPAEPAQPTTTVRLATDAGAAERWVTIRAWRSGPGRMEGVLLDVTGQRAATLALRERERRFGAIFDHMVGFIGLLTPDGRIIEANQTALRLVGATEADVLGQRFWDTPWWSHSETDRERLRDGIIRAAAGELIRFETTHRARSGRLVHVDFSLRPILDDTGSVVLIVPEGRDVTHLKETEAALREAKREAEAANRSKTQFLAVMSHELRTPLNAILGYSEIMQAGMFGPVGSPRYQGYVDAIHASGRHLLEIIDDILEISRIELGVLELNEEPAVVADLMARAGQILANRAAEAGVNLDVAVDAELPLLLCDARRVIQMLVNLAYNGIKFSRRGDTVHLAVRRAADGGMTFAVRDTGPGIPPEDMERIWEPFGQAGNADTRCAGGVGLGLTITRALIEAHGGTIALTSAPGTGTTVTLAFPPGRCRAGAPEAGAAAGA
ncbi:PAS domain-containing protein [Azospirillum halopraeferens]|uniref:sensor histidine kinase n=1 Tax=Azospirillum halopraeferens TaxID=34010 RepID=UPI0004047606|nr:PAS domain-containing protein [Azospirillum halopraeferens]